MLAAAAGASGRSKLEECYGRARNPSDLAKMLHIDSHPMHLHASPSTAKKLRTLDSIIYRTDVDAKYLSRKGARKQHVAAFMSENKAVAQVMRRSGAVVKYGCVDAVLSQAALEHARVLLQTACECCASTGDMLSLSLLPGRHLLPLTEGLGHAADPLRLLQCDVDHGGLQFPEEATVFIRVVHTRAKLPGASGGKPRDSDLSVTLHESNDGQVNVAPLTFSGIAALLLRDFNRLPYTAVQGIMRAHADDIVVPRESILELCSDADMQLLQELFFPEAGILNVHVAGVCMTAKGMKSVTMCAALKEPVPLLRVRDERLVDLMLHELMLRLHDEGWDREPLPASKAVRCSLIFKPGPTAEK
eukprot:3295711-Amphidinium_carterae.1